MNIKWKKKFFYIAAALQGAALLCAMILFDWDQINSYQQYNTETLSYVRGRVLSVDAETLELDSADSKLYLGEQELTVELLEGTQKGTQVIIDNYLTYVHNIRVSAGSIIIVCADTPKNAAPYYTVFNYDRSIPLILLIALFCAAVILIGGTKGIRALLGVGYSLMLVVFFLAQSIYHGFSPIGASLITVLLATGASLLLLNGLSRRTAVGTLGTLSGVGITAVIFALFSLLLHLSGYNMDDAEALILIRDTTGLNVRYILLAGVLISALGAVMDVAVSLGAALEELVQVQPSIRRSQLIRSGFHIGRDMIGTMSNTLILAYAGTALSTMLVLIAYGYRLRQLFSSDYLTIELTQGLCGTLGVVLTVPITAVIAAFIFIRSEKADQSLPAQSSARETKQML